MWDAAPLRQGAAQSTSAFDQIGAKAEAAAKRAVDAYSKMYGSIERGRQQFVSSQINAAEQAANSSIRATIRAQNANTRSADAESRAKDAANKREEASVRRKAAEVQRINDQTRRQAEANARLLERAETQLANHRIREAQRAQRAQSDASLALLKQQQSTAGPGLGITAATAIGSALGLTLANILSSITNALREGTQAWIEYASKIQNAKIAFTAMLGSSTLAEAHLKSLQKFALETPFRFDELVDASQRMQALGFGAQEVVPILRDVGNAVAAAGGGGERLERVIKALADVRAKEKLQTQEIRQFAEAGISAYRILEEETGKSVSEIQKDVEAGRITAELFLGAFRKFSQLHFGDLMAQQSKTFTGAMSNIQDVLLQVTSTSLAPFFDELSQLAFRTQQELQKASDLGSATVVMTEAFAELGAKVGQGFIEGLARSLTEPRTYAALAALASAQIRAEFKVIFGNALGDPDAIIPGIAIDKAFHRLTRLSPAILGLEKALRSLGYESLLIEKQIGDTSNAANEASIKFNGQSKAVEEVTASMFPMLQGLEKTYGLQRQLTDAFPKTTEKVFDQAKAYKDLNAAIKLYQSQEQKVPEPEFFTSPEKLREYAKALQETLILEIEAVRQAEKGITVEEARDRVVLAREKAFKALDQQIKETAAALAGPGGAQKAYDDFISSLPPGVEKAIRLTRSFEKAAESVNALTDKSKKSETELQRLTRQFEKLSGDVDSFRNLGTAEFALRFKVESLERVKSDFEKIITLRRELGQELSAPLPEPTDTEAIKAMIRSLESEKRLYEANIQLKERTSRIEEAIAIARAKQAAGPIDAKKQAELMIEEELVEQQERRVRVLAEIETIENRITLRTRNAKQEEVDATNEVTLALHKRHDAAAAAYNLELAREKTLNEGTKRGSLIRQAILSEEFTRRTKDSNEAKELILRNEYFLKVGLIDFELELAAARSDANRRRVEEHRKTAVQIQLVEDQIQRLLSGDQGERESTIGDARLRLLQDRARALQQLQANRDTGLTELQQRVSLETEQADLESRIIQLQIDLANGPYNESLRIQAALLEDIIALRNRDEEAVIRENRAQLELMDATIVHSQQVRAQVLEHLASQKSITEAFGDSIISVYDQVTSLIDRGIDKLTKGLGVVNELLKSIARQVLNRVFQRLLDAFFPPAGGTVRAGTGSSLGGQGGGGGGNLFSNLLGFLRPGASPASPGALGPGTTNTAGQLLLNQVFGGGRNAALSAGITNPQTAQAASLAQLFNGGGGSTGGFTTPSSLTSQLAQQALIASVAQQSGGVAAGGLGTAAAGALRGGSGILAGLQSALGFAAPLLGLQLGSQVGGPSLLGNILGGAGGLALGGIATAALAPGLLTSLFGGTIAGVGGATASTGIGGALGGLLTGASAAFVVAPIAAALLLGAHFLKRNKVRRREETERTQVINDALGQLNEILRQVKMDSLDGSTAISSALQIRTQYLDAVSRLTDRKTRDHALQDVTRLDIVIAQIRGAGDAQARRQKNLARIVPEFKGGAQFYAARGLTRMPGPFDGRDDIDMKVSRGEHVAVMTPSQFARIGKDTFERAGVPSINIDEKIRLQHGGFLGGSFASQLASQFNPHGGSMASSISSFSAYAGANSALGANSVSLPSRVVDRLLRGFDTLATNSESAPPASLSSSLQTVRRTGSASVSGAANTGGETKDLVIEIGELVIYRDEGKAIARGVKSPDGYNAVVKIIKQVNLDRPD